MIQQIISHKGKTIWNKNKPNGTPRKILDSSRLLSVGWNPKVGLYEGIKKVYSDLESNQFSFN
jgi:GDP-L-fucose synthase|tara:strand:- start:99 stop:287 length:189 start_codon:yes stop_codon:yes gene_type:complete